MPFAYMWLMLYLYNYVLLYSCNFYTLYDNKSVGSLVFYFPYDKSE